MKKPKSAASPITVEAAIATTPKETVPAPEPAIVSSLMSRLNAMSVGEAVRFVMYVVPIVTAGWLWIKPLAAQQVQEMMNDAGISVQAFKQTQGDIGALQNDLAKMQSDLQNMSTDAEATKNQLALIAKQNALILKLITDRMPVQ